METNGKKYIAERMTAGDDLRAPIVFQAAGEPDKFIVSAYTLNKIKSEDEEPKDIFFPGNICPEGYFFSPFYEVTLKELEDELQSINVRRINFLPERASVTSAKTEFYNPDLGIEEEKDLWFISLTSPTTFNAIVGQPFCIYDIEEDMTYRGFLDKIEGSALIIATETEINSDDLRGVNVDGGKSRYIISLMEENAPEYAEFLPATQRLVWRGLKKMSDLESNSPIYNMPFTNGRLYIHKNFNVFVRRQDPHGEFKLFRPSQSNPLRRFQIEGSAKLDFDYIQSIIDSMVNAC